MKEHPRYQDRFKQDLTTEEYRRLNEPILTPGCTFGLTLFVVLLGLLIWRLST